MINKHGSAVHHYWVDCTAVLCVCLAVSLVGMSFTSLESCRCDAGGGRPQRGC